MITPAHLPHCTPDAAVRRPEVVGPSLSNCDVCLHPACAKVRHCSGALVDLCTECLKKARRESDQQN